MNTTKLQVEVESDPVGLELENKNINLDLFLQPADGCGSLINFYEGSLVGKKKQLKKDILKRISSEKINELEAKLHSNREPLSKPIGTVTIDKELTIITTDLKV